MDPAGQEQQAPAPIINPNIPLVDSIIDANEQSIKRMIKKLEESLLKSYQEKSRSLKESITFKYKNQMTHDQSLDKFIPFTDFTSSLMTKLAHTLQPRQVLVNIISDVHSHPSIKNLTPESVMNGKTKFDLICDYSRREVQGAHNTGELYTEDLCLYLIHKTFKKSANESYESFFRVLEIFETVVEPKIATDGTCKIASIGGGPGSDLCGAFAFVSDYSKQKFKKFQFAIYDLMAENWKKVSEEPLTWGLYKPMNNGSSFKVAYETIDLKDPETAEKKKGEFREYQIITVAWALNEAVFVEDFWVPIIKETPNSLIVFVEGKDEQLVKIDQIAKREGRSTLFCRYENPRRLFILPNGVN